MIKTKLIILSFSLILVSVFFSSELSHFNLLDKANIATSSDDAVEITDANFEATIKKGVVLVDFWATWCGPCRKQGPIVSEIAADLGSKAVIGKLDVDKNKATAAKFNVRSIPTIIIFKDGKVAERIVGLHSKEQLMDVLNRYI